VALRRRYRSCSDLPGLLSSAETELRSVACIATAHHTMTIGSESEFCTGAVKVPRDSHGRPQEGATGVT